MSFSFDPDAFPTPPDPVIWATQIEGRRSGQFKFHKNKGQARNAINVVYPNGRGIIYELVDGEWKVFYKIPFPQCSRCESTDPGVDQWGRKRGFTTYRSSSQEKMLVIDLPILCYPCHEKSWAKAPVPAPRPRHNAQLIDGKWKFSW